MRELLLLEFLLWGRLVAVRHHHDGVLLLQLLYELDDELDCHDLR